MTKSSLNRILLLTTVLAFAGTLMLIISLIGNNGAKAEAYDQKDPDGLLTVRSPKIPKQIDFAGETAPLELFYVREGLDRELLVNAYWHSSTILMLKRANRWFPIIEPILKQNNIPDDFKYLALIESGFTKVVSPRGAAGFWQFMEKTAREHDLEVNDYVDERYNVEKSTGAACNYLQESFERYHNWTLVAAAYNAGNRRISESLEKQQGDNYYELYLNEETSRYVYRILAIKTIYEQPENYGFQLSDAELYPPLKTRNVEVSATIADLVEFGKQHGMNYRLLKELNPWLLSSTLPDNSGKVYYIKTIEE